MLNYVKIMDAKKKKKSLGPQLPAKWIYFCNRLSNSNSKLPVLLPYWSF